MANYNPFWTGDDDGMAEKYTDPVGLHKSWPTLVHVQIATEDLETLHPVMAGLCFIMKVWLVTLIMFASPQPGY